MPAEPEVLAVPEAPAAVVPLVPERASAAIAVEAALSGSEGRMVAGQILLPRKEMPSLAGVAAAPSPGVRPQRPGRSPVSRSRAQEVMRR